MLSDLNILVDFLNFFLFLISNFIPLCLEDQLIGCQFSTFPEAYSWPNIWSILEKGSILPLVVGILLMSIKCIWVVVLLKSSPFVDVLSSCSVHREDRYSSLQLLQLKYLFLHFILSVSSLLCLQLLYPPGKLVLSHCKIFLFISSNFFVLKSILSDTGIAHQLVYHPSTFNVFLSLNLRCVFCSEYVVVSCFLNPFG